MPISPQLRYTLALLLAVVLLASISNRTAAQSGEVCFAETQHCISGRILEFWLQNGSLPIFGLPISPLTVEFNRDTGATFFVQWFERHRLELHPDRSPPYDVLLGRIGVERLTQQGIDWQTFPRAAGPEPGCLWFAETGHNVCDQLASSGFKTHWQSIGLRDPRLTRYEQSLALFGLPLSDAYTEVTPSGQQVLVQWFERARFEWHPLNPPPYNVLLGLLGSEIRTNTTSAPVARILDGLWQGETSQVQRILFSIENNAIQAIIADVNIRGEDCQTTYLYTENAFNEAGLASLSGDTFSLTLENDESRFTLTGSFTSDATATGSLELTTKPGLDFTCVGSGSATWTVARQLPEPPTAPPGPVPPTPVIPPAIPPGLPDSSVDPNDRTPTPTPIP